MELLNSFSKSKFVISSQEWLLIRILLACMISISIQIIDKITLTYTMAVYYKRAKDKLVSIAGNINGVLLMTSSSYLKQSLQHERKIALSLDKGMEGVARGSGETLNNIWEWGRANELVYFLFA